MSENKKVGKIILIIFLCFLSLGIGSVLTGTVDLFFDNDGIANPSSEYQRLRMDEYSDNKPFFQWWYFTIKDLDSNQYFTFHYNLVDCANNLENEGTYVSFSVVDDLNQKQWHKYEKFELDAFVENSPYDAVINVDENQPFSFNESSSDSYTCKGEMNHYTNVWNSINCSDDTYIKWDLTLHRICGWYGQQDMSWVYDFTGIIHWNPYGHDCEVEGTITINSTTYTFTRSDRYRAYADMNWGENFPAGSPGIEYPWGWYYASLPNSDPDLDLSIIAGIGYHYQGFPFGTCQGQFADIRLNSTERFGVRQNDIWGDMSYSLVETSSEGELLSYDVERDGWANFTDEIGTALIPLHQKVIIVTHSHKVILDYHSDLSNYNRLLFPHEEYVFSDFEALGVNVTVTIYRHDATYKWWDLFKQNPELENEVLLYNFTSDDGGLEYGYNLES